MTMQATALICAIMLTSCGGGSSDAGKTVVNGLSGNWQIMLQNSSSSGTQSGFLLQTGTNVTGSLLSSGQTISGQTVCSGVGSVQGQIKGADASLTVILAGQSLNLTGATANNLTSMSGDYSILASGCGQTETGTWSANQVNPLTGSFQSTFAVDGGIVPPFHYTGTITEGANTGASIAPLSGTMSSTDTPCFTTATIAGVITGTSVVVNILRSTDGRVLGKYSGTMTTDATSVTGRFAFTDAAHPGALGPCEGYGGNATFTVQAAPATT